MLELNEGKFKRKNMSYVDKYLTEVKTITEQIDHAVIERMIEIILNIRRNNGTLFFLGVGGGAGNASHAVNDFRKIAGVESSLSLARMEYPRRWRPTTIMGLS
jgi:phosphoheptose isomerase